MTLADTGRDTLPQQLRLDAVSHSFIEGHVEKRVLAPITRSFDPGRFYVIGGPSGAGKTTLLSILSLTVKASQGHVHWGEQIMSALPLHRQAQWRRQNLGLVFQTSRLVSVMTVKDHIRIAARIRGKPAAEAEGMAMITSLGLADKHGRLPAELSGGEKQRVALAQALCARPALLLADEPTAALDQRNAALVAETLRNFARTRNAVVICISHDRIVMDAADDLMILEKA
jgi:putative ABC transport system ATP-binding protein